MLHDPIDIAGAEPLFTLPRLRPLPHPDSLPDTAERSYPDPELSGQAPRACAGEPAQNSTLLSVRGNDGAGGGSPGSWPAPAPDILPRSDLLDVRSALYEIAALRLEQIVKWGHTPQKDLAAPVVHLPREARDTLSAIVDDIQFHRGGPAFAEARPRIRKRLLKAGALIAAALDRLDAEPSDPDGVPF